MKKHEYLRWFSKLFGIAVVLNFSIEALNHKSIIEAYEYLVSGPAIFILNTLIIMASLSLVFAVRRKAFVLFLISIIWLAMGIVNGVLLSFRTTPFTAVDLRLITDGASLMGLYLTRFQIILMLCAIAAVVMLGAMAYCRLPVEKWDNHLKCRVKGCCITGGVIFMTVITVQQAMAYDIVASRFGNIGEAYSEYGFPYCFSNSLFNTGISKPDTYDPELVEHIAQTEFFPEVSYDKPKSSDDKPDIIMIQLESFFDTALLKGETETSSPVFHRLYQNYPSGYLNVPSVGAGTANTEFEILTGMNLDFFGPGEYPYKTVLKKTVCESAAFDLKQLGYGVHAIHNNEATFYGRHEVFSQLGFDTFTPIEYMKQVRRNPTGWCKDDILTDEILKTLDSTEESDFIYTISVQGHGAYPDFEYYKSQIKEMDHFIAQLIFQLKQRQEPVVLVLYGDHLPGFEWTPENMVNESLYQTQYVIWNNLNLPKVHEDLEAYQLTSRVFDMLGIHEGIMTRYHQQYLNLAPEKRSEEIYMSDMEILEYDILYGDQKVYNGNLPYEPSDIKYGTEPISIEMIVKTQPDILIFGKNFTEYSKIFLDGDQLETSYVWPGLIIARDVPEKRWKDEEEWEIEVWQVGRDQKPLGQAEELKQKVED